MRVIGQDICRAFAEVVALQVGLFKRLWRLGIKRQRLAASAAARSKDDVVVGELTDNAVAVAGVICLDVRRGVIANSKQARLVAHAQIAGSDVGDADWVDRLQVQIKRPIGRFTVGEARRGEPLFIATWGNVSHPTLESNSKSSLIRANIGQPIPPYTCGHRSKSRSRA